MAGLVEAIQNDALNPNVSVSTLLRKVKLAAAKLQLPAVEEWVESELNGYIGQVPEYRRLKGEPRAFNPYRGWIPIGGDPKTVRMISKASTNQSIAAIEDLVASTEDGGYLHQALPPEVVNALNRSMEFGGFGQMSVMIGRAEMAGILDIVRNKVLDWAIELEKQGITGEGLSFDAREKEQARALSTTVNIGTIGNFAGNLGHGNKSGSINAEQHYGVFDELRKAIGEVTAGEEKQRLEHAISGMEAVKDEPKGFAQAYAKFIGLVADHITVINPFLPALGSFLG